MSDPRARQSDMASGGRVTRRRVGTLLLAATVTVGVALSTAPAAAAAAPARWVSASVADAGAAVVAAPVARVKTTGGSGQSAVAGKAFAAPLSVLATDRSGTPVAGAVVVFTVTSGSATFGKTATSASVTTAADGTATSPALTAGATAGKVTVTATSGSGKAGFVETVKPRAANLQVGLTAPVSVASARAFKLKITVVNKGPVAGGKTTTRIFVPASLVIVDAGGGTVIGSSVAFVMPSIPVLGKATYSVTVKSASGYHGRAHVGVVTRSNIPDPVLANNSVSKFVIIK